MDVNSAAAGSEFEWRVWPITYFIAAKFIVYSAAAGLCIQTKRCVTGQAEVNLAASGSEVVAAERVKRPVKGNRAAACFHRDLPLKIVRVDAAATSAHAHHPTRALKRDSSRAILQLYIATGRHSDLEIDSAQTKLEDAPGHAA